MSEGKRWLVYWRREAKNHQSVTKLWVGLRLLPKMSKLSRGNKTGKKKISFFLHPTKWCVRCGIFSVCWKNFRPPEGFFLWNPYRGNTFRRKVGVLRWVHPPGGVWGTPHNFCKKVDFFQLHLSFQRKKSLTPPFLGYHRQKMPNSSKHGFSPEIRMSHKIAFFLLVGTFCNTRIIFFEKICKI